MALEDNTSCEIPVEVSQKSTQDLIDSIFKDDKINEEDRAKLQQLLLRKETEVNLVQSITHEELKSFMENDGAESDWFMTKDQCELHSDSKYGEMLQDVEKGNYINAIDKAQSIWRERYQEERGRLNFSTRPFNLTKQDGEVYILVTQGELGPALLRLSDFSIQFSGQKLDKINASHMIKHAGKIYVEAIRDNRIIYINTDGEELSFDDDLRLHVTDTVEYNGKIYILAENTTNGEFILVSPDGERLFDGYGIDEISGKTLLQGKELKKVIEYEIKNGYIIVISQYMGERIEKVFSQGVGDTSQIEQIKAAEETNESKNLLSDDEITRIMQGNNLEKLDTEHSIIIDGKEYFYGVTRQGAHVLLGKNGGGLGGPYSFKAIYIDIQGWDPEGDPFIGVDRGKGLENYYPKVKGGGDRFGE